ncbi:MAG: trigger factor [Candidatus Paceibacterota bacterium]
MNITSKKLADSKVELTVDLDKNDLASYVRETEEQLAKEIKMEGFRQGKAPKEIIRKKIGEDKIKEEALQTAVQSSLREALAQEKLDVIDQADFKIKENSADKLVYNVTFVVFPEVNLSEYKNLGVKKNEVSVEDSEIDKVLNDVQKSRTTFNEVKRPAEKGDRAEVDFTIKDKGTVIDGGKSQNHPVVLGDGLFVPGFEEQIIGMTTGETKNFSLKIPLDYYQKAIAGKDLDFEVTVNKVEDRSLPELNDEFAKTLGKFSSMDEVKDNIRKGLTIEKEGKEKDRIRLAILDKIGEKTKIEAPDVLIEKRIDDMISGLDNELHQKGMELGPYLAHIKKTQDDLRKEWRPQAEAQVKMSLIARAVAKEEKLVVSDEDVNNELQAVLQQHVLKNQGDSAEILKDINPDELKRRIKDMLTNEKVFDFLEKNNVI